MIDRVRDQLQDRAQPFGRLAQFLLRLMLLGGVVDDAQETAGRRRRSRESRRRTGYIGNTSVGAPAAHMSAAADDALLACRPVALEIAVIAARDRATASAA